MVVTAIISVTAPDVSDGARVAALVCIVAHAGLRLLLWRRGDAGTPLHSTLLDMALTTALLLLVPLVGVPGLFVILLLTARLAVLMGFRAAAASGMAAWTAVAVRVLFLPEITGDLWFLMAMFAGTTVATAAIIDHVVRQRDKAAARLDRIEAALARVSEQVSVHPDDLATALADATSTLVRGVSRVRLLGLDDVAGDDLAARAVATRAVVRDGTPTHRVAVPLQTGGATPGVLVVTTDDPMEDVDLQVLHLWADRTATAVLLDRSRQREHEAREELELASRLREELLARVSHDLKVPLATVVAASRTLLEHDDALGPTERERLQGMVDRNAARLHRWIDDLFEDARHPHVDAYRIADLPLCSILTAALDTSHDALRRHRVDVSVPDEIHVRTDAQAAIRVCTNLLTNAAKFAPAGTRIRVDGEVVDTEVVVTVSDEGPGIAPEDLEQVFDPWTRRGHDDAPGTGLGLSTVRQLVQRWGGRVWAESPARQGARLRFTMPLAPTPATDAATDAVGAGTPG